MAKLNKENREKRRLLILERLKQKKTISSISKELNCGASTVFRIKRSYKNYMARLNYNTIKHNERLEKKSEIWKRKEIELPNDLYFNGFSLKEQKRKRNPVFLIKLGYIYIRSVKIEVQVELMEFQLRKLEF